MGTPQVDSYGRFDPNPGEPLYPSTPTDNASGGNLTGVGSPEGVVTAGPGQGYVDTDSGTLYVKVTGDGDTGWTAISGGSGATQVSKGHGAPAGSPSSSTALYYDLDTGVLWQWDGSAWN